MSRNRMSGFEVFIGTWNTSGEVLETENAPATTLTATDSYRWLPGRHFIVHEVDARFGDAVTRSMELIGYDRARRRHLARSYDDRGLSETFEVRLAARQWRIVGQSARFKGRFDAQGNRLTGLWELKGKKSGWQPWIQLELVRA